MEKIHKLHGFRWTHPAHEVLEYNKKEKGLSIWVDDMVLDHYPDA